MRNARFSFVFAASMMIATWPASVFAQQSAAPVDPHGQGGPVEPGLQLPQDTIAEDPNLPFGTITAEIRDGAGKPRPRVAVTLGILSNSVAKGESKQQIVAVTDEAGRVRWDRLQGGSTISYRVAVSEGAGEFAAVPFRLDPAKGTHAVLHTYPVATDLAATLVVLQSILYVELKDDRVQVQQAYNIYNFGKVAWAPSEFVLPLPTGFTALTSVQGMNGNDQVVDPVDGRGARLRGTFGPGRHSVEFRWQLPYGGETSFDFSVGMPPNLAAARVMVVASQEMKVSVDGFPPVKPSRDGQGNAIVETERELRRDEAPVKSVRVQLANIPGPGPARYVASGLALVGIALGFVYSRRGKNAPAREKSGRGQERSRVLAELEELERARHAGEIGPRTYENARRELIDALARTLAGEAAAKTAAATPAAPSAG